MIPPEPPSRPNRGPFEPSEGSPNSRKGPNGKRQVARVQDYPELHLMAQEPLTVVTWNLAKRAGRVTRDQVEALVRDTDARILAFQECRANVHLPLTMGAHVVRNFGRHGVMTVARAAPHDCVPVTSPGREWGMTPKVALLTTYALSNGQDLLVANIHALNFDRGGRRFADQLRDLAKRLAHHAGPMIFCGDMNTWNGDRVGILLDVARDLDLTEVPAERGVGRRGHATKLGNRLIGLDTDLELDRIFYRGLELEACRWMPELDASDHVPLLATFRIG